jgi:hypothetical protein
MASLKTSRWFANNVSYFAVKPRLNPLALIVSTLDSMS